MNRDNPGDAIAVMIKSLRMDRDAATQTYNLVRSSFNPVPTVEGVERMALWQALAVGGKPKKAAAEYMDLHFLNQVLDEIKKK